MPSPKGPSRRTVGGTSTWNSVRLKDDFPPHVRSNHGIGILSSLFGARCRIINDTMPWVEHLEPADLRTAIRQAIDSVHAQGKWADLGLRGLWENMRGAFGDINLYENMLLDPEWIRDYCRTYTDLYTEELGLVLAEAGKPDGVWFFDDLGYRGTTFCNPELYAELIFPFYVELVALVHRHGMPAILHTCGYTESVLPLIVLMAGLMLSPTMDDLAYIDSIPERLRDSGLHVPTYVCFETPFPGTPLFERLAARREPAFLPNALLRDFNGYTLVTRPRHTTPEEFGRIMALRALIMQAPEMEREVVEVQLRERFGDIAGAAKKVKALGI